MEKILQSVIVSDARTYNSTVLVMLISEALNRSVTDDTLEAQRMRKDR